MRLLEHLLNSWFLVDPVVLCRLPALNLLWLEPKGNFLLRAINGIRTVADIAADIDGVVTTDGARGGGSRVGSTEEDTACLYGVTAFPDHGTDWAGGHVGYETREEGLGAEVFVVLLEVLFGGSDELDGYELEAAGLKAGDDGTDKATLDTIGLDSNEGLFGGRHCECSFDIS